MNQADTAWMLISTALVLLMTPALAFFYGGLVRSKNALNTMMMSFISLGFVGVLWAVVGYSLALTAGNNWLGDLSLAFLNGVGLDAMGAVVPITIPHALYMAFQATFCIITAALISGAIVERMRFSAYLIFICLWSLVVYAPVAHWVWGGGWLADMGAWDFAGGTVVHVNAGAAALVAAFVVGKRSDYGHASILPHNIPTVLLGAGLLWFGWFGFNAGSELTADSTAAVAFVNTQVATAAALLGWIIIEKIRDGKPTLVGASSGAVAGLVAITPACGNVSPLGAIMVGLGVSIVCYAAVTFLKPLFGYDDSLDAFGVHGLGGAWGALASGIFATTLGSGIESNAAQIIVQLKGIAFVAVFAPVMTVAILSVMKLFFGSLRVTEEAEYEGLDLSEHSESAYTMGGGSSIVVPVPAASGSEALAPAILAHSTIK